MRVFVTGGTGFLGRRVVAGLAAAGHEAWVLARPGRTPDGLPAGIRLIEGDVTDIDSLGMALQASGASAVLHMAALVSTWQPDPGAFTRVNVGGLENLLKVAYYSGVEKLVYTSSVLALGPTDGELGDERRPPLPLPGNRYIETKAAALARALEARELGYPLVCLYPGIVYGPGPLREAGVMTRLLWDHMRGRLPAIVGPGDRRWCHAYIDDVAAGHLAALERAQPGQDFVLGGPNATLREWLEQAARISGRRPPRWSIPYPLASAIGGVWLALARLTRRAPQLTPDVVRVFAREWAYSSRRAEQQLGYRITTLEAGLSATAESLRRPGPAG